MDKDTHRRYLKFAVTTAELAGATLVPYFRSRQHIENKSADETYDPVTPADRAAEHVIRERITRHFPDHGISGEEFGYQPGSCPLTWYVDPIDGTRNFAAGLLHWGTMLALSDGERPILGVVHHPLLGESYCGLVAGGALLVRGGASRDLHTRCCRLPSEAIITTSDPIRFKNAGAFALIEDLARAVRDVHHGSECYGVCLLASGLVDVVLEVDLDAHDVLPLIPIAEGAGGVITDWDGNRCLRGGNVLACGNADLHAEMVRLIARSFEQPGRLEPWTAKEEMTSPS